MSKQCRPAAERLALRPIAIPFLALGILASEVSCFADQAIAASAIRSASSVPASSATMHPRTANITLVQSSRENSGG